jgi:HK97 family phage major capsid protein
MGEMMVSPAAYSEVVELREKRKTIAQEALDLASKAKSENREFTVEERQKFDKITADVGKMSQDIEAREALWRCLETEQRSVEAVPAHLRTQFQETGAVNETEKRQIEALMWVFKNRAPLSSAPPELRSLQITKADEGGYLMLPERVSDRILKKVDDLILVSPRTTNVVLEDTKTFSLPSLETDLDPFEFTVELPPEIQPDNTMRFGKRQMVLRPYRKMILVTEQFLNTIQPKSFLSSDDNNGVSLTPMGIIENRIAYAMARTKESMIFVGNGTGRPLGLYTASTRGIPTSRDIDVPPALSYPTLVDVKYSLKSQYHSRAVWLMHRTGMQRLMKLVDNQNRPLLNLSTFPNQPDTLLQSPVLLSEFNPSVYTAGSYVGLYGDLSYYMTVTNRQMPLKVLDQLFARTAQVGVIAMSEIDGMPASPGGEAFARMKVV